MAGLDMITMFILRRHFEAMAGEMVNTFAPDVPTWETRLWISTAIRPATTCRPSALRRGVDRCHLGTAAMPTRSND
jgi:hypothetical protein